jgi:hypothetical protein
MWVLVVALDATLMAIARRDADDLLVVSGIIVVFSALWLLAVTRTGVYIRVDGIECRPFGNTRTCRYSWDHVNGFVVQKPRGLLAVAAELKDGRLLQMPGTMGWQFEHREIERLCAELNAELYAASGRSADEHSAALSL